MEKLIVIVLLFVVNVYAAYRAYNIGINVLCWLEIGEVIGIAMAHVIYYMCKVN